MLRVAVLFYKKYQNVNIFQPVLNFNVFAFIFFNYTGNIQSCIRRPSYQKLRKNSNTHFNNNGLPLTFPGWNSSYKRMRRAVIWSIVWLQINFSCLPISWDLFNNYSKCTTPEESNKCIITQVLTCQQFQIVER